MGLKKGTKIPVKIGKHELVTVIDSDGVQRLPTNPIYRALLDSGALDLNKLCASYQQGLISKKDYLEFYLNIGYSVCGFSDLSFFQGYRIHNPLWDKE